MNMILENESYLRVSEVKAVKIKEQKLSWDKLRPFNVPSICFESCYSTSIF